MNENLELVEQSLSKLEHYIYNEHFEGYDPYDALTSPLFSLPFFNSNKIIRLGAQQIVKHLPINIRSLIGIKKGLNPVTLGLALQSIASLIDVFPDKKHEYITFGNDLVHRIEKLASQGYSGKCWGYDFDWQARYATIPAYCPTIVATGFITNALFLYYSVTNNTQAFELCKSATQFVLRDIKKTHFDETFCFSYSPRDSQVVYNATMKGARLLAQVYSVTQEEILAIEAEKTVQFVINKQQNDGSWTYSHGDTRTWVDNFHTGYVLDCLDEFIKLTDNNKYQLALEKGIQYYVNNFFIDKKIPKYYSNELYPIDLTAGAQSILTLLRFGYTDIAINVALYLIDEMQNNQGYFYYQKTKYFTNKISYMRWSNAWMFAALSALCKSLKK